MPLWNVSRMPPIGTPRTRRIVTKAATRKISSERNAICQLSLDSEVYHAFTMTLSEKQTWPDEIRRNFVRKVQAFEKVRGHQGLAWVCTGKVGLATEYLQTLRAKS